VTVAVILGRSRTSVGSTPIRTLYVTTFDVVVPAGSTVATVPVNVRPGYAVSVNETFCPGWIFPMSASLTEALTCGVFKSFNVMKPFEAELELDEVLEADEEELEPVGPPLIHCPTAPLSPAMVPPAGATSAAAARLF
jgi:hypothetical protein